MIAIRILILLVIIFLSFIGQASQSPLLCRSVFVKGFQYTEIPFEHLDKVQPLGRFHRGLLNGQDVFIKTLRAQSSSELNWLIRLNSWGLGPKLLGVTQLNGQIQLVLETINGINTQFPMMAPEDFRLTQKIVAEMQRQTKILAEHHVSPLDLQFLISLDCNRVTLIDPELFSIDQSITEDQVMRYLNSILRNWKIMNRL